MNNNNILCDHKCPLHEKCVRYLDVLDRTNTDHIDPMPYKNDKCSWFVEITEDDIVDKVQQIINRRMN